MASISPRITPTERSNGGYVASQCTHKCLFPTIERSMLENSPRRVPRRRRLPFAVPPGHTGAVLRGERRRMSTTAVPSAAAQVDQWLERFAGALEAGDAAA